MTLKRRRWVTALLVFTGLLLLAVMTLPFWAQAALRPLARAAGITYEELIDKGDHLLFRGFAAKREGLTLTVQELQMPPLKQWWRLYRGGSVEVIDTNAPVLKAVNWKLTLEKRPELPPQPGAKRGSARELFEDFQDELRQVHKGLPSAELANGKVVYNGKEYTFGNIKWSGGVLESDIHWPELVSPGDIVAELPPEGPYRVRFRVLPLELSARVSLIETNGAWAIQGTNTYKGNRFRFHALFNDDSFIPSQGNLSAKNLRLPAKLVGVTDYEQLTGSIELNLEERQYTLNADTGLRKVGLSNDPFISQSAPSEPEEPEVRVSLQAQGAKSPRAFQPAVVSEGKIIFPSVEFEIEQGIIQPQPGRGWFPLVELLANGRAGERQLTLKVTGPANNADVALSSEPPLPPAQLESLLQGGDQRVGLAR